MNYGYVREVNSIWLDKYNYEENKLTFMDSDAACDAINILILSLFGLYNNYLEDSQAPQKLKYDIKKNYLKYIEIHSEKKEKEENKAKTETN